MDRNDAWVTEKDRYELEVNGYPALIIRHPHVGNLCGYIGITEDHPLFGKDYMDIEGDIDVHGGLTFTQNGMPHVYAGETYYKPMFNDKGEKLYWLGFDCAHSGDHLPFPYQRMLDHYTKQVISATGKSFVEAQETAKRHDKVQMFLPNDYETYKTVDYVKNELQKLAKQLDKIGGK